MKKWSWLLIVVLLGAGIACKETDGFDTYKHESAELFNRDHSVRIKNLDESDRFSKRRKDKIDIDTSDIKKPENSKDIVVEELVFKVSSIKNSEDSEIEFEISLSDDFKEEKIGRRSLGKIKNSDQKFDREAFDVVIDFDQIDEALAKINNNSNNTHLVIKVIRKTGVDTDSLSALYKVSVRELEDLNKKLYIHLTSDQNFTEVNMAELGASEIRDIEDSALQIKMSINKRQRLVVKDKLAKISNSLLCLGKEDKRSFQVQIDENMISYIKKIDSDKDLEDAYTNEELEPEGYLYVRHEELDDDDGDVLVGVRSRDDKSRIELELSRSESKAERKKDKKDCRLKNVSADKLINLRIIKSNGDRESACCKEFDLNSELSLGKVK